VISSTHGYTESHVVHVVAYDAAGNKSESDKVRFFVIHRPEPEEEEEEQGAGESGALWLPTRDQLIAVRDAAFPRSVAAGDRPVAWRGYG
jgi:hypothetical protein